MGLENRPPCTRGRGPLLIAAGMLLGLGAAGVHAPAAGRSGESFAAGASASAPATPFQTPDVRARFLERWKDRIDAAFATADTIAVPSDPYLPDDIRDPVFGYLIGMFDRERYGLVTGEHLQAVSGKCGRKGRVPTEQIRSVASVREAGHVLIWSRAEFVGDLRLPVPYSLLGYHPGRLISSATVTAREWHLPRVVVPHPVADGTAALEILDVTMLAFVEGYVEMDIDGWLDRLLGEGIDDTQMIGLAVFRYGGERYSMALGYNDKGEPRSGALHMGEDEVRFPTPAELKSVARHLRQLLLRQLGDMGLPASLPGASAP
ncbi:MAG: hypothetical protein V1774_01545 [Candidatus Eisenbacteria bacterium]